VADAEKRSRIQAASDGPPAPLQLDPRGAVHQHTVEVEQDGEHSNRRMADKMSPKTRLRQSAGRIGHA
jgi:hypothetical protein